VLYKQGANDPQVYIILFGKISLRTKHDTILGDKSMNIGWTLGEEILFDRNFQVRQESAVADTEACLLGITKNQLATI